MVIGTTILFSLGYIILSLSIWKKNFFSTIFLIIKIHPWNELNLDTRNNIHSFCYGHYNRVYVIGIHDIEAFGFARKAFLSNIFLITKVHPWNERNKSAHNNLHSSCYWHYNHVLHFGIHDIDTLDLQEKLFFLRFYL